MIVERPELEQRVLHALDAGRIPVLLGGCGSGRTSALLRLASLLGEGRAQYVDVAAAATTPERCLQAIVAASLAAPTGDAAAATADNARAAFDALMTFLDAATAPGGGPVTFLLDEVLDIRTFESFPGLRHVQRDLMARLAASPNGFVLASRFTERSHRLLRDATARFEVIHIPPFGEDDVQALARQLGSADGIDADQAGAVAALGGHRAATARILLDRLLAQSPSRRNATTALAASLAPDGPMTARSRESYEFRLHRARGYGALKAILGVLAEGDSALTLTEIAHRLHRTPGSTKDYLSWLEDVDLVLMQRKRYVFADPLLRVHLRLYGSPLPPTTSAINREAALWSQRCRPATPADVPPPTPPPAAVATARPRSPEDLVGAASPARPRTDRSGIIEID